MGGEGLTLLVLQIAHIKDEALVVDVGMFVGNSSASTFFCLISRVQPTLLFV